MRAAEVSRTTTETDIRLTLNLDGSGQSDIHTGVGFLDHMLTLFARHANFDLALICKGDTWVDDHHSVEDIGITLGAAFREALKDKRGICRYASLALPMDEALVLVAVDISGRGQAFTDLTFPSEKIGSFDTELVKEFFQALAANAGITLHVRKLAGENSHHIAEAAFKGLGHALRAAVSIDPKQADRIPSTKGLL
jgi:imidazoleglycerol-phosphate dehydratase